MTAFEAPHKDRTAHGRVPTHTTSTDDDHGTGRISTATGYVLGVLRIAMGWYFLWAFIDKTFGLGYATPSDNAWIDGGSPTTGFLGGAEGPFGDIFNDMAGSAAWDWLFMIGLLGIGLALILGIGMRIAAVSAALLLVLMFAAALPLVTNPVIDSHLTEALTIIALAMLGAGNYLGFGQAWRKLPVVRNNRWLI